MEKKPKLPTYEVEFIPLERRLADRRRRNLAVEMERRKQAVRRGPDDEEESVKKK
ncbi:MAG: hypothetical protein ACREUV_00430 [Burkholderiales bacterium]